jgi:hypothetical protein
MRKSIVLHGPRPTARKRPQLRSLHYLIPPDIHDHSIKDRKILREIVYNHANISRDILRTLISDISPLLSHPHVRCKGRSLANLDEHCFHTACASSQDGLPRISVLPRIDLSTSSGNQPSTPPPSIRHFPCRVQASLWSTTGGHHLTCIPTVQLRASGLELYR